MVKRLKTEKVNGSSQFFYFQAKAAIKALLKSNISRQFAFMRKKPLMMHRPRLLLLDTSAKYCSVAISGGKEILYKTRHAPGMKASERLHIMVAECLEASGLTLQELDALAVSIGPGSYTGLRIGLAAAKGFCYALNVPLIAIPTLSQLAVTASLSHPDRIYIPMMDARRDEVYMAVYDAGIQEIAPAVPRIVDAAFLAEMNQKYPGAVFCGDGAFKIRNAGELSDTMSLSETPAHAEHMLPLVLQKWEKQLFEDLHSCVPIYLKSPNITMSKKVLFD
jgi:tRNA threonylcarbamoyladenosine biosynthesis protein TsaB